MEPTKGSLSCVGIGMTLGSHLAPLARSYVEQADVVFVAASNKWVEEWVMGMNGDVRTLQPFYAEGKSRMETYTEMVEAMMSEVRSGKRVCGAFYGHPGIFAWVPHKAVKTARAEGFFAHMEPGISAEDCLYADLGLDPGTTGCQHFEATQFMVYRRCVDPSAWLILWQVGIAGDRTLKRFSTGAGYRDLLVEVLARTYPMRHEVIVYRAAVLPIYQPRIERVLLRDLPDIDLGMEDTLAVPPAQPLIIDEDIGRRLADLDNREPLMS